jgi:hypothetical protein
MPRHPPNALKTLDHSHCQYPSLPSRTFRLCGGYQQTSQTFSNDRFDKKDQLLEINPMALRLSGQSSCKGINEPPMRRPLKSAHAPKGLRGRAASAATTWRSVLVYKPANPLKGPGHIFSSQFIQNTQVARHKPDKLQTCFFLHMISCAPMVEPDGIEPTTPCLQSRCSPS